jgi:hypothetical protein
MTPTRNDQDGPAKGEENRNPDATQLQKERRRILARLKELDEQQMAAYIQPIRFEEYRFR